MTNEEFLQKFRHFLDAPKGVQKLREMVLQLAVQGKLVSHNPDDERVSELLNQIQSEKVKLTNEGKRKKIKSPTTINESQKPFNLPDGWLWVRLGEAGTCSTGKTPSTKNPEFYGEETPFVGPGQITPESVITTADKYISTLGKAETSVANKDDILMVCIGGSIGKCAVAVTDIAFNQQINCIKPFLLNSRFLLIAMKSTYFQQAVITTATGSATPIINRSKWEDILIPVAPLAEQHRIVARVDELMALCDQLEEKQKQRNETHQRLIRAVHHPLTEATGTSAMDGVDSLPAWHRIRDNFTDLYTTKASVQALRQTILQLAVQGKLVEQDVNEFNVKKVQNEDIPNNEDSFAIPSNWLWCKLRDLANVTGGCTFKSSDFNTEHGAKVIKITNAGVGEFIETSDYLPAEFLTQYAKYVISKNDLILALTRPYISTGLKVSLCPASYDQSLLNQRVAAIRVNPDVDYNYIFLFLKSPVVLAKYKKRFSGSGLQPNLKMNDVSNLIVALPPLSEQHRIVAKADELMALCDQLEAQIDARSNTASRYAEAVVHQIAAA